MEIRFEDPEWSTESLKQKRSKSEELEKNIMRNLQRDWSQYAIMMVKDVYVSCF